MSQNAHTNTLNLLKFCFAFRLPLQYVQIAHKA